MTQSTMAKIDSIEPSEILLRLQRLEEGLGEIKAMLVELTQKYHQMEVNNATFQPLTMTRLDAAWKRIDEHSSELSAMSKIVQEMEKKFVVANLGIGMLGVALGWIAARILEVMR